MKIHAVHLLHPGTPVPGHLTGEALKSWQRTAEQATLCWRFNRSQVKTTDDVKQVTCYRCKMAAKQRKTR